MCVAVQQLSRDSFVLSVRGFFLFSHHTRQPTILWSAERIYVPFKSRAPFSGLGLTLSSASTANACRPCYTAAEKGRRGCGWPIVVIAIPDLGDQKMAGNSVASMEEPVPVADATTDHSGAATSQQCQDVLLACSVHGLGGSKGMEDGSRGRGADGAGGAAREAKRGWLSSLNTAVGGDRQENVML